MRHLFKIHPVKTVAPYVLAVVLVSLAFVLRWGLQPLIGSGAPLMVFIMAVMISAWVGGLYPGLVATILSAVAGGYFFMDLDAQMPKESLGELVRLALFVVESAAICVIVETLQRARARLQINIHELEIARETADKANQAKTSFLAMMSHEIRTPLGGIVGFTDLLGDGTISDAERLEFVETVKGCAAGLLKLVDEILDIAKIESGRITITAASFSLPALVKEVLAMLNIEAAKRGLSLNAVGLDAVPEFIQADSSRVRQVLINLVSNAIKFTDSGTVTVTLGCAPRMPGQARLITIEVKDSGLGILPEKQSQLFQPFSQVHVESHGRPKGTGLGLELSRRIARAMDGDVKLLTSVPHQGSTFVFSFVDQAPNSVNREVSTALPPTPAKVAPPSSVLSGRTILLADDSAVNQRFVAFFLTKFGAKVEMVNDGEAAVEAVKSRFYDLILMDLEMPVCDGYTATRRLRDAGFERPILALTAHALEEYLDRARRAGCTDVVLKPVDASALVAMVSRHLIVAEPPRAESKP